LSKLNQIDEKKIFDSYLAQEVFLLKHLGKLSEKVERKLVPKVLEDVYSILENEWAREISRRDFFHGHICAVSQLPIFDIDDLLSESNVRFLYHTFEWSYEMPGYENRNIKSSLISKPEVIPLLDYACMHTD